MMRWLFVLAFAAWVLTMAAWAIEIRVRKRWQLLAETQAVALDEYFRLR